MALSRITEAVASFTDLTIGDDLTLTDDLLMASDGGIIKFGADADVTLTHIHNTGLRLNGTTVIEFNDTSQNIGAPNATTLDINATDEIELNATLVDINANLDVSGTITGTGTSVFTNLDISGDVDVDGTLEADAMTLNGTAITTTATLSTGISNNNVPKFTSGVADNDFLRVDGTAIEGRSASEVLSDIGITLGISSGNVPSFASGVADDDFLRIDGTSVEGRSAAEVLSDIAAMPLAGGSFTGTVTVNDNVILQFGTSGDFQIKHDGSDTFMLDGGTGDLKIGGSTNVVIQNANGSKVMANFADGGSADLYHNNTKKFETTAAGVTVTGTALATTDTDTSNTGSVTLDFSANQNFVLTLTGNVTLANPSTEQVGQSGFIVCIQDGTGGRTLSLGTDYETVSGAGITLSSAASATDIIPYVVAASNRILLGAPQLAFS